MQITIIQIIMIIAGLMSFTMVVGSGLAMYSGEEGLSNRTRKALIFILLACVLFWPLAGSACDEDDLTDYSAHHLLVVCTPVKYGYVQNPYYTGTEKCGVIAASD